MRITKFWAQGYRSLRDVTIDGLGPFNVFYGRNGAGKSNVLAAMQTFFALLEERTRYAGDLKSHKIQISAKDNLLDDRDRSHGSQSHLRLGATIEREPAEPFLGTSDERLRQLSVELTYEWEAGLRVTRLETDEVDLVELKPLPDAHQFRLELEHQKKRSRELGEDVDDVGLVARVLGISYEGRDEHQRNLRASIRDLAQRGFSLVGADRYPRVETLGERNHEVSSLLAQGKLKEAFFRAANHPDALIRRRYRQLKKLIEGPPLERPPFVTTHDPETGRIDILEETSESPYEAAETPLDLAGLGIAQIYSILGQAVLSGARAVGIEEPEAHLHAPTSGMQLRQLLERLVNKHYVDQFFIATHSNLFDLDPQGYFEVELAGEEGTRVTRKPLKDIDKKHLYEPGPAKHALQGFLEYMDTDAVVFRTPDGSPVSAGEMLAMLQRDDPLAKEFLDDVHGAAVRAVRVKSKKAGSS